MDTIVLIWLIMAILLLLRVISEPFKRTASSLRFNPLAPVPPVMIAIFILVVMDAQNWTHWRPGIALTLSLSWAGYYFLMFGYSYDGLRFSWFNGLWRRTVDASSVKRIVWCRDKRRIAKVRIVFDGRIVKMRTDLKDAVDILSHMVEDHQISTATERLARWSL